MKDSFEIKKIFRKNKLFFSYVFTLSFLALLGCCEPAQAALVCDGGTTSTTCYVSTTQTITNATPIAGSGNLVIQSGGNITCAAGSTSTITMTGDVTIQSGGTITCNLANLSATNLDIQSGGSINVNVKGSAGGGWGSGSGTGGGGYYVLSVGGGASYGGIGGWGGYDGANAAPGSSYGSTTQPTDLGSGGGGGGGYAGGAGGGAVKLTVSGTLTLNGTITANGGNGSGDPGNMRYHAGGGSGGSVWIITNTLAGAGTTTANGGNGYVFSAVYAGGAGGGGRISILYTTDSSTIIKQVFGSSTGYQAGGAGTLFIKATSATNGDLIIDNNNIVTTAVTSQTSNTSLVVDNITIKNKASYTVSSGASLNIVTSFTNCTADSSLNNNGTLNLLASFTTPVITITNNGVISGVTNLTVATSTFYQNGIFSALTDLTVASSSIFEFQNLSTTTSFTLTNLTIKNGGIVTHKSNSTVQTYTLNLVVTNLDINFGGSINVNAKGSAGGGSGSGSGTGGGGYYVLSVGGGASYGGIGGWGGYDGANAAPGSSYGSTTQPTDLGSGGGGGGGYAGGAGGGAVKLTVSGTLTLNGTITANGGNGSGDPGNMRYHAGGGSGGSVWIITNTLAGAGTTTANGGNGYVFSAVYAGGAGGGGRVYINASTWNYTGTTITANGATTGYQVGANGTVMPYRLAFNTQPSNTITGQTLSAVIAITDILGVIVSTATNTVTIAISTNPGSGTLSGTMNQVAVNGTSTFTNLSINKIGTGYTLIASASGLTSATSSSFNITAGVASKLYFSQQPSTSLAGSSLSNQPIIVIQDANDNFVSTATNTVTIAISTNPGSGTLSGTTNQVAVNGTSTFTNLSINKIGTGYTLIASASGLTSATSSSFNITASAKSKLFFTQQPSSTSSAGIVFADQSIIVIQDVYGNIDTSATDTVTIALETNPGSGILSGTVDVAAISGSITFTDLKINRPGSGYILQVSALGLTSTTSNPFTIIPGSANTLIVSGITTPVTAESLSSVNVTAYDSNDNIATAYTGTIHFTSSDTGATLPSDYTFLTTDLGTKSFTNSVKLVTAETKIVTATDLTTSSITGFQTVIVNSLPVSNTINPTVTLIPSLPPVVSNPTIQSPPTGVTVFSTCPLFLKDIYPRETSNQVKCLQQFLKIQPQIYPESLITGYFGPATKRAIILFQEKYKDEILKPWGFKKGTGIVGPSTRKKINRMIGQ